MNATGAGKHVFVQMPVQTPGAANLPAANEGGLITRTLNGSSELYYARDAVNTYYQLTGPVVNQLNPTSTILAQGSTVLLGGIILKWGHLTSLQLNPIPFATPFPNNVFSVVVTPINNPQIKFSVFNITLTGFNYTADTASQYNYIAIGN